MPEWPERAETHPFAAEDDSELGYMDDPYQEEPYEELLTPEFITSERDTLWMVEVLETLSVYWFISCFSIYRFILPTVLSFALSVVLSFYLTFYHSMYLSIILSVYMSFYLPFV